METKEIWKDIIGYPNYQISNYGNIKSLNYNRTGEEKLLKPKKDSDGYLNVVFYKNGVRKYFRINRLVYMTFVGDIPEDIQVNHIDEDKENNRVENLNLMTSKENIRWGTGIERRADARRGKHYPKIAAANSKAVQALNPKTLEVVYEFPSTQEAERQYGFLHSSISQCCNGKLKTHKGLIWRYKENAQE